MSPVDTKANLRMMISRLEDELAENLDNRAVAARLRKRIDKLTQELAQSGGYFANRPSSSNGVIARAEAMQEAYSAVGNALFALKRHLEGIERYYADDKTIGGVSVRFAARDLLAELDAMIRSDEFQQLNEWVFSLAEAIKGTGRR